MTRDEMTRFEKFVRENPMTARDIGADVALAALRSRPAPPDLSTRERQVLGRLVSEMEALSEPMYGEMRNALKKVLAWSPAPPVAETPGMVTFCATCKHQEACHESGPCHWWRPTSGAPATCDCKEFVPGERRVPMSAPSLLRHAAASPVVARETAGGRHKTSCRAYSNYQPPYEECTCGLDTTGGGR